MRQRRQKIGKWGLLKKKQDFRPMPLRKGFDGARLIGSGGRSVTEVEKENLFLRVQNASGGKGRGFKTQGAKTGLGS